MCILVIFIMAIANIISVTTNELINLDELFFPIPLNTFAYKQPESNIPYEELQFNQSDMAVSEIINKRVRLLCWIPVFPSVHERAIHIKETWGKRCDILLFMSTEEDPRIPTVKLSTPEGRDYLWGKTQAAFQYIYQNYLNEVDWFFKADLDTYVIVENLKFLLDDYNNNDLIYFGSRLKYASMHCTFMSGGAGYVLSKEAVISLVTQGLTSSRCNVYPKEWAEDLLLGSCLGKIGVISMDSRDMFQKMRFFPLTLDYHIRNRTDKDWYKIMTYYPIKKGRECCSEYTISFHYVNTKNMYAFEYFVYHLRPYGISYEYENKYSSRR